MKLRIKGDSIRLRVTQPELAALLNAGRAADAVRLGPRPQDRLTYALRTATDDGPLRVEHAAAVGGAGAEVTVVLPREAVRRWRRPDEVGIAGDVPLGDGTVLRVLVEKDFACLDARPEDQDAGTFPNPAAAAGQSC
ncbi:MAG TPA: hypothetical protein VF796_04485 [Humisphaera sp.]